MTGAWLIYNPRSRTADEALVDEIETAFAKAGRPIARKLELGEDELPDVAALREAGVSLLVQLSGDGSVNSLASALDGWEGALLVLPGGTMNLLSRSLHGDAKPVEIVERVLAGKARQDTVPTILHGDMIAYTGIIAGPTAAWGDVREDLRKGDLKALGEDALQAVSATFEAPSVSVAGHEGRYPAIFVEPGDGALRISAVKADHPGHLLAHGWAWLMGDFRTGPFEPLVDQAEVRLQASGPTLELLVDGEQMETQAPAIFRSGRSGLAFVHTAGADA